MIGGRNQKTERDQETAGTSQGNHKPSKRRRGLLARLRSLFFSNKKAQSEEGDIYPLF